MRKSLHNGKTYSSTKSTADCGFNVVDIRRLSPLAPVKGPDACDVERRA